MSDLDSLIDDLLAWEKSAKDSDVDEDDIERNDEEDDIEVSTPPPGVDVAALRKSISVRPCEWRLF